MQMDTRQYRILNNQLRLLSRDLAACRRGVRDLHRLAQVHAVPALTADASGLALAELMDGVAPALCQDLRAAANRLAENAAQLVQAAEIVTNTAEPTAQHDLFAERNSYDQT
jgi:hypothetical protein